MNGVRAVQKCPEIGATVFDGNIRKFLVKCLGRLRIFEIRERPGEENSHSDLGQEYYYTTPYELVEIGRRSRDCRSIGVDRLVCKPVGTGDKDGRSGKRACVASSGC